MAIMLFLLERVFKIEYSVLWTACLTSTTKILTQKEDASLLRAGTHCCSIHMIMLGLWHCGYEVRPGLWSSGFNTCSAVLFSLHVHSPHSGTGGTFLALDVNK